MTTEERIAKLAADSAAKTARNEDEILAAVDQFDPSDQSEHANYLREVAEGIRERRASAARNSR